MYKKIFIVGCSRSGTTLLQKLLSERFNLLTFPETRLFLDNFGGIKDWLYGSFNVQFSRHIQNKLRLSKIFEVPSQDFIYLKRSEYISAVEKEIHMRCETNNSSGYLEKTPLHLFRVETIAKNIEGATFIHIVREGNAVRNSIINRSQKYPHKFGGQSEQYAVNIYNSCLDKHFEYLNDYNHVFVSFEQLVADVDRTLLYLSERCNLKAVERSKIQENALAFSDEYWKSSVTEFEKVISSKAHTKDESHCFYDVGKYLRVKRGCINNV